MFDVLTMAALNDEFANRLVDGRIQRILQIGDATVGLEIYAEHQRLTLIASADNREPRLYITGARVSADPDRVSPLLLLLRKYARGGRLIAVQQPPLERILRLSIAKPFFAHKRNAEAEDDEREFDRGAEPVETVYTHLIVELMGRRSNIILTDDTGRILDAAKRVTPEMSRVRPILPGSQYVSPPPQVKQDPRRLTPGAALALLASGTPSSPVAEVLVRQLAGFSPQMAREATYRAFGAVDISVEEARSSGDGSELSQAVAAVLSPLEDGRWAPVVYRCGDEHMAFSAIHLDHLGDCVEEPASTISEAIERYLAKTGTGQPVAQAQRRARLVAQIHEARERAAARLRSLEDEQERMEAGERWREMGELIYAYLYRIEPGQTELDADGVIIPLDPERSPSENAQAYFERYRKAQSATANLPRMIEQARTELAYLEQLETLASFAEGIDEVEQVRSEWEAYQAERQGGEPRQRRKRQEPRRPQAYRTERGDLIYVGRNGRQNDLVTFDIATPDDLWLHARNLPGAHVILRPSGADDPEVIEQAARLAAYYSGGRHATTVDVDVTKRRYVRKIKGAGPGMVTYREESTINVRPASPEELGLT